MEIAVLISGGVDSSVALARLARQGDVKLRAFYLKIWLEDELQFLGECPWEEDLKYARAVCEQYDIPLEVVPLQQEYHDRVVSYTIDELKAGRTPSPDLFCNQRIKFGAFFERFADQFDRVATGHYAYVLHQDGKPSQLLQGLDPVKDQSYFLSHLRQDQVRQLEFPLGNLHKAEVRALANEFGLANATRKDSQGICFLGQIKYNEFVKFHLGEKPGRIIERETGKVLGTHLGYWFHTVGQRKGLGLGGGPWYVVDKDIHNNVIYVSGQMMADQTLTTTFDIEAPNWIAGAPIDDTYAIKVRHGQKMINAEVRSAAEGRYHIALAEGDRGIADGQFAVVYKDRVCLGSGRIKTLSAEVQPRVSSFAHPAQG